MIAYTPDLELGIVMPSRKPPEVDIIYHMFPHYRAPVMRALSRSTAYEFRFFGSHAPVEGIVAFTGDGAVKVEPLGFKVWKGLGWFSKIFKTALRRQSRAVIFIGNPNYPQIWLAALLAHLFGKRVLFWAHGWLKTEPLIKASLRNLFYGLGDAVLVYDDRAIELASKSGFPPQKVVPIYNSLDWDAASPLFEALSAEGIQRVRKRLGLSTDQAIAICTARLTPICRFDLLLDAAALLKQRGVDLKVVLIGDGPSKGSLETQAAARGVDALFLGAIYDEAQLADWLFAADMTVSPGKVGLTAMHSLTYGTPVVTHSDRDTQMPEVEAITDGVNGALFEPGSVEDLVDAISRILGDQRDREELRVACRSVMQARYTPQAQTERIVSTLDRLLEAKP